MSTQGKSPEETVPSTDEKLEAPKTDAAIESQSKKIYLKAMPLRSLSDLDTIKNDVKAGNVIIIKITPMAEKSLEGIKNAINDLCEFIKTVDGDIARLGEERIVVTPAGVRIWREKTVAPEEHVPTAA